MLGLGQGDHPLEFRTVVGLPSGYAFFLHENIVLGDNVSVRLGGFQDDPELGVRRELGLIVCADADVGAGDF